MNLLEQILQANKEFVLSKPNFPPLSKAPNRELVIFTCMDTRLVDFLEPAMGIGRGEAKVLKNAGNTIVDPNGGIMRSLVVAVHMLGCKEIFVIGHKDCGMACIDPHAIVDKMISSGVDRKALESIPDFEQWIGCFADPVTNLYKTTDIIRKSPLIPTSVPVHGLLFCPDDGHLDIIVNGYEQTEQVDNIG